MTSLLNEHTQYVDAAGDPIANGKLYIGTNGADPVATAGVTTIYSDRALTTSADNPQTLDANGRTTDKIAVVGKYSIQVNSVVGAVETQEYQDLDAGSSAASDAVLALSSVAGTNAITGSTGETLTAYTDGQLFVFKTANESTGSVTLNVDAVGAKTVIKRNNQILFPGEFHASQTVVVAYNSTNDNFEWINRTAIVAPGLIFGLTLSNGTDTSHDIDIAVGQCSSDNAGADDVQTMDLAAVLTKQIDAAWAVGDDAGGLDTGTVANSTWYHVFLIKRSDTGVVDALFSTSATTPTMPTNYDFQRRIGSVLTDGSANITQFLQYGDDFLWLSNVADVVTANPGTSQVTEAMSVPTGLAIKGLFTANLYDTDVASGGSNILQVNELARTDNAANTQHGTIVYGIPTTGEQGGGHATLEVWTNTSAQIGYRVSTSDAGITVIINTKGWTDTRGRLS